MSQMFQELIKSSPFAIIDLYELHTFTEVHGTNEIYRFHNGSNGKFTATGDIKWKGYSYIALPIEADGFEYTGNGQLPRPKIRVANLLSTVSALMINVNTTTPGNDLTGAKLIRIRTLSRFLDGENFDDGENPYGIPDPDSEAPQEIYYVDRKVTENRDFVEFELAAAFDLAGVRAPKRQCIANICQWQYRSAECGYTGTNYFDENDSAITSVAAPNFPSGSSTLSAGQSIYREQQLVSSNRWYIARVGPEGDLFIRAKNQVNNGGFLWQTKTGGSGGYRLTMQQDGNLVLYTINNNVVWASNTNGIGSPSAAAFNSTIDTAWSPKPPYEGHRISFFHEIMGFASSFPGQTRTQSRTFQIDSTRQITLQFTAISVALNNHYSGQAWCWADTTSGNYPTPTVIGSTGLFRAGETFNARIEISGSNPFRSTPSGTMSYVTGSFRITQCTGFANRAVIQDDGNFVVYNANDVPLWAAGVVVSGEPRIDVVNSNPLDDVCGKRLSSCKARFGENAELPFGSFPSLGSFTG
jgi:lambda family phage minor tail protein L